LKGVEVIIDYAHNEAALKALGQAVQALPKRRTIMALTLPGDRRDKDLIASVKATTVFADDYVLFDAEDRRGRDVNEVPSLLCNHLPPSKKCEFAPGEQDAVQQAWRRARPGERLVLICDEPEKSLMTLQLLADSNVVDSGEDGHDSINSLMQEQEPSAKRPKLNFPSPQGITPPLSRKTGPSASSIFYGH